MVDGYPRQVWVNEAGDELIESYTITHMAHGTPLATGKADDECGAAGPFLLEVGISSSYHIAKFFGLTNANPRHVAPTKSENVTIAPHLAQGAGLLAYPNSPTSWRVKCWIQSSIRGPPRGTFPRPFPSISV